MLRGISCTGRTRSPSWCSAGCSGHRAEHDDRRRGRVREREQLLAEVSNWLDDYCFIEEVVGSSQQFVLGDLRKANPDPRSLAGAARKKLGLADQPIHDICGLL